MKITALVENTALSEELVPRHGLSLYVEAAGHKLLFDLGSDEAFARNAETLGVPVGEVDTVVISHGHRDHGGGLGTFLEMNDKATIYIHKDAFGDLYDRAGEQREYIGLDKALARNERIVQLEGDLWLDDSLFIFSGVQEKHPLPPGNANLFRKTGADFIQDDFRHEQNLLVFENDRALLLAGCAHRGISNIVEKALACTGKIDRVIGGFHLSNPKTGKIQDRDYVQAVGRDLIRYPFMFHTGHCTGIEAYGLLSEIMKDKLRYLATGSLVEV